jgi:hypothetical protein
MEYGHLQEDLPENSRITVLEGARGTYCALHRTDLRGKRRGSPVRRNLHLTPLEEPIIICHHDYVMSTSSVVVESRVDCDCEPIDAAWDEAAASSSRNFARRANALANLTRWAARGVTKALVPFPMGADRLTICLHRAPVFCTVPLPVQARARATAVGLAVGRLRPEVAASEPGWAPDLAVGPSR